MNTCWLETNVPMPIDALGANPSAFRFGIYERKFYFRHSKNRSVSALFVLASRLRSTKDLESFCEILCTLNLLVGCVEIYVRSWKRVVFISF